MRRILRGTWRALGWLLLLVVSGLLLTWLALHWLILPHIDEWRARLEHQATTALGLPVQIGRIEVRSGGWMPALALHQVQLLDVQGRPALQLPLVSAALSPQSLLSWRLRFAQLYMEGPQLDVRRDHAGRLHVAGLDLAREAADSSLGADSQALDWLFQQTELVIRHGQLRWTDEMREAPPLVLQDTDLVVRNGLRHHDLRLDATPPSGWGERFSLRGRFTQPLLAAPGEWQRWSGSLHADLPRVDVAQLHRHVALPFELRAGDGALRLWLDLDRGQWRDATLDLALDEVRLRLARGLEPLALGRVQARLRAQRSREGIRLSAENLQFATADGLIWPASQLQFSWQQAQDRPLPVPPAVQPPMSSAASAVAPSVAGEFLDLSSAPITGGTLSADRLDLALMAAIASRLPLPDGVRRGLVETDPQGLVRDLHASWSGPLARPDRYHVVAQASDLSIDALPASVPGVVGRPGWHHADLRLDATERGGQAQLSVRDGLIDLPGVFEEPQVALDRLQAQLAWQLSPPAAGADPAEGPQIALQIKDLSFANPDAQGQLQARWQTGSGSGLGLGGRFPGQLELTGRLDRGKAARVARYLPLGLSDTRHYLQRAILDGEVSRVQFKVTGDLWAFPFNTGRVGEFRLSAQAEDLHFAYVPPDEHGVGGWPAFSHLNGELVIDRGSLQIRKAQARVYGLELQGVNGQIPDLLHDAVLRIDGTARGPLPELLRYVNATPIADWTQQALQTATATGPAELKLALNIPLAHTERSTVKGTVAMQGNALRLRPDLPPLDNLRGRLDFDQQGFHVSNAQARLLGGEAQLEVASAADGVLRVAVQGTASAEGLRRAGEQLDQPALSRAAALLSGQTAYKLQLGQWHGQTEFTLTSPLTGLGMNLPAPLGKAAEQAQQLRLQAVLSPETTAGAPTRDTWRLSLGSVLQAEYQRDLSGATPRVLRGAIAVGEALPTAAPGQVLAALNLGTVNLDAWMATVRQLCAESAGGPNDPISPYQPSDIHLRAQSLSLGGRQLTQLQADLLRRQAADGEHWRATVISDQLQGSLDYRLAGANQTMAKLHARLARLAVPQSEADAVDSLLEQASGPVPALDIVVDDFELRGRKLGKLEVEASYRGAEGGREARDWRLSKLNLSLPEAKLVSSGTWTLGLRRRMALDFRLDLGDSGALLEHLGLGRVLRGGKGHLQGQLAWNGSPLSPAWSQMTGGLQMALDGGQFLKIDPGAGRLLGVLSMQSLPRRFLLDFRDVFQEGFAFDNISGDLRLADGVARTNNLRIRGVQAVVMMEGQTHLRQETQDLKLYVVPELNAGTASLAYAAINPAIGLGTFVAQLFLRKPLMQASTREFHVGGTWSEPTVEPVQRKVMEPLPDLDAPALPVPASAPAAAPAASAVAATP